MPSCGLGSYGTNANCGKCAAGKYTASFGSSCTDCAVDTYSDSPGTSACPQCPWPRANLVEGSTTCEQYYPNISVPWILLSLLLFASSYLLSLGDTFEGKFALPLVTSLVLHVDTGNPMLYNI